MKQYIGTKFIQAVPMTREQYNEYRGWTLPADEDGNDEGYLVEYLDGGQSNHPAHNGYVSWSPKNVFERAYFPTNGMTFGLAIEATKMGYKVAREGWNGKGMWIRHVSRSVLPPAHRTYIEMKTVDDQFVPWVASQSDILADDWRIAE